MEAFSLLNFWRNAAGDDAHFTNTINETTTSGSPHPAAEMKDETDEEEDSFFDLEFTVPDFNDTEGNIVKNVEIENSTEDVEDLNKDLNGKEGEIRSNIIDCSTEIERRTLPIEQPPISLLKSPPKSRECMLGFQKPKLEKTEINNSSMANQSKRFATSKCEVEEVSIGSLFHRDNSSLRSKMLKQSYDEDESSSKRFPKDVVRKYLKLIKPLYVRVSKRYSEKMKSSNRLSATPLSSPATAPMCSPRKQVDEKQGSRAAALRVVCKHLGKSRSASSATVGIVPSPASRRDDSLLQQHDGIQSAIQHCKRSFNSSRESSFLARSASDNRHQKSISPSIVELNRCSI